LFQVKAWVRTAGCALSSHGVALGGGADGAVPHRHDNSSELFYILDGAFDLLVEDDVVTARTGDLLVVPPGAAHAFGAHRDSTAEALIIATPGIERFDYFRHVVRRREGSEAPEVLLGLQDRFDTHCLESAAWRRARTKLSVRENPGPGRHRGLDQVPAEPYPPAVASLTGALDPGGIGRRGSSRAVPMAAAGMYEDVRPMRFNLAGARASQAVVAAWISLRVPGQVRGDLRAGRGRRSGQGRRIGAVHIGPEAPG
jgi:uncharacterized RmlC-like cupin family protein